MRVATITYTGGRDVAEGRGGGGEGGEERDKRDQLCSSLQVSKHSLTTLEGTKNKRVQKCKRLAG